MTSMEDQTGPARLRTVSAVFVAPILGNAVQHFGQSIIGASFELPGVSFTCHRFCSSVAVDLFDHPYSILGAARLAVRRLIRRFVALPDARPGRRDARVLVGLVVVQTNPMPTSDNIERAGVVVPSLLDTVHGVLLLRRSLTLLYSTCHAIRHVQSFPI